MSDNPAFKMRPGERGNCWPPIIEIIGSGREAYLWIGSEEPTSRCFATLSDDDFQEFAKSLNKAIGKRSNL